MQKDHSFILKDASEFAIELDLDQDKSKSAEIEKLFEKR